MEKYNRLWRSFIAVGLIAIAVQQLINADFRPVVLPPAYPAWLGQRLTFTLIFSLALIGACACILFEIKARAVSLLIALVFLVLVIVFQVPFVLAAPKIYLASWADCLKELSFSGAAFVIAGTFVGGITAPDFFKQLGKLIPAGK